MIRGRPILVIALAAGLIGCSLAVPATAGLLDSVHDFSNAHGSYKVGENSLLSWDDSRHRAACRVCHVPVGPNEMGYGSHGIAWNSRTTTKARWQLYQDTISEPDLDNPRAGFFPLGVSKLCLGCHDGVIAVNQYESDTRVRMRYGKGRADAEELTLRTEAGMMRSSVMMDHPISVVYDEIRFGRLRKRTSGWMANGDPIEALLFKGRVECSTCHDVHNRDSIADPLLRSATKGADVVGFGASRLCITCHDQ